MTSDRYFFSPQPTPETINNYISSFYETLAKNAHVVNYNKKPVSRSIDFLRYAFRTDVMVLNWPEDVIHLRLGILQFFIAVVSLSLFKIKGGKIIWVCHNKESHVKKYELLRKFSRTFFTKISNFIIVHSSDAIGHFPKEKHKVFFLQHPIYDKVAHRSADKDDTQIEVLIWGNITPYKGLDDFIKNYKKHGAAFNATIIGKADKQYLNHLTKASHGLNITIKDQFLSEDELYLYFKKSKIILLPYLDSDTFSSGSLIHSLNSNKIVIGPGIGNFIDVNNCGACLTYKDYPSLFYIIRQLLNDQKKYDEELRRLTAGINKYYTSNSWDDFIKNILCIDNKNFEHPEQTIKRTKLSETLPG